ncbi:MAG: helix-turn-helix domain-containing protein [Myxococcota bacterium]
MHRNSASAGFLGVPAGAHGKERTPKVVVGKGFEASGPETDISSAVANNLARIRAERGLSLAQLSEASGVSRAMLNQIERGKSAPTINVVFKITTALSLPFSALLTRQTDGQAQVMRADRSWQLRSKDGAFSSRALFPLEGPRGTEFYELEIEPKAVVPSEAHRPGTTENLVVNRGALVLTVNEESHTLEAGDAIVFAADKDHIYENPSDQPCLAYLVMTYA